MKQRSLIMLCIIFLTTAISFSQFRIDSTFVGSIYFGVDFLPISTENMRDVHISDWEKYGNGSDEGRVALPLSEGATNSLYSFHLGLRGVINKIPGLLEVQWKPFGKLEYFQLSLGLDYRFVESEKFNISIVPKIGYGSLSLYFGKVAMLPGKKPPVITPEGTFYVGDSISTKDWSPILQLGININYYFRKEWGINFSAGYTLSFLNNLDIQAGNVKLSYSSKSVVKPEMDNKGIGSTVQAGIDPKAKYKGAYFTIGMVYEINRIW